MAEDTQETLSEVDALPEEQPVSETADAAPPTPLAWDGPTYHLQLWNEPPTYLCLPCNAAEMTLAEVESHLMTEHGLTPLPTPLAADYGNPQSLLRSLRMEPTYRVETDDQGQTRYVCLLCAGTAVEHWSRSEELMKQHQEQRHGGQMIAAQQEQPPAEGESSTHAPVDATHPPTEQGEKLPEVSEGEKE